MSRLIVVPTPIGNRADITQRALEVLKAADFVLAEDTRTTGALLRFYGVEARLRSLHMRNEHLKVASTVEELVAGATACMCSDAGTPGISDPGYLLVKACVEAGVAVECLPGPTAFVPALVVSGLPCERFVYEGFLPHKKGRLTRLAAIAEEPRTTVLYESPHRIQRLLNELVEHCGPDRPVSVSREISKMFEETTRGSAGELAAAWAERKPKGEFVVVIGGFEKPKRVKKSRAADLPHDPLRSA
jgi:16S rRNA (cytidine1402-2'-O)-methyltransferase